MASIVVGLLIGSFLNVVIHRVPRGESVLAPPSSCPRCGRRLTAAELVPVVSFLVQRGRCRGCGEAIGWIYPVVEVATAVAFACAADVGRIGPRGAALAVLFSVLIVAVVTDLRHRIIPNAVNLWGFLLVLAAEAWGGTAMFLRGLEGAAAAGGIMLLLNILSGGKMGMGDVKLSAVIGAALGPGLGLLALFLGFLAGALAGLALIASRVKRLKDYIPFGPALAFGAWVTAVWGPRLLSWYSTLGRVS